MAIVKVLRPSQTGYWSFSSSESWPSPTGIFRLHCWRVWLGHTHRDSADRFHETRGKIGLDSSRVIPVFSRSLLRGFREKSNVQLRGIDALLFQERVIRDDISHFLGCSDDDGRVESDGLKNCLIDMFREGSGIFCRGLKNYVPTLDVRVHVPKAETFAYSSKNFHLDCVVSAYVDASQHRDVSSHSS